MNRKFLFGLKFAGFALIFFFAAGGVTMLLWNWLMPAIFGLPALGFLQAFGLLALARILVGGFSRHRGGHWGGKHYQWRRQMMDRWESMTPEERLAFRERMRGGCSGKGSMSWNAPESDTTAEKA